MLQVPELVTMRSGSGGAARWGTCFILQNVGILSGVGVMVLIALFEQKIFALEL